MDAVRLKNLSYVPETYTNEAGPQLLRDINLAIRTGEWVALLGLNGSGKSTLAGAIAGRLKKGITGERELGWLQDGFVPIVMQQPDAGIIGGTAWEDVVLLLEQFGAPQEEIIPRAERALMQLGLGAVMKEPVHTLSGGQKQLAAIAGCLAVDASLLLLDEVTSMLDTEASDYVLRRVRELHEAGTTVIWVTQKTEELLSDDRVIVLADGVIRYDGMAGMLFRESGSSGYEWLVNQLGLTAPFAAQAAWELQKRGIELEPFPFTPQQLLKAVKRYG
ncbi:ATP-binding cassette domain-containing protein [Paenibacillus sp. J5C_2022]|uniref:ATP-binding cassette domain-containing protein n=1 Tax=Paenibacillus sp. J5C2022 TaxID=2977129 RepID=UPI0021D2E6EE|nr:ATP-binding cassette domain-containing protein [Paenibacillus sp. J5C2022]MCU6707187.1 ATP-binding cassette domain-containing protein [Paenibacillus sp. J5C2022]